MLNNMKKAAIATALTVSLLMPIHAFAAPGSYTVVKGDSLWRIAVKTETGLQELIAANPQLANPSLIYPGQVITIPEHPGLALEQEVIRLVNVERAKVGLTALKHDWEVARVAEHKSHDMARKNYFSHTSPTYGSPFDMLKAYGVSYRSAGENIAQGQRTAQEVVNAWMNSPGHRANILKNGYTHIGIGYAAEGHYWTQLFIQR